MMLAPAPKKSDTMLCVTLRVATLYAYVRVHRKSKRCAEEEDNLPYLQKPTADDENQWLWMIKMGFSIKNLIKEN